MNTITVNGREFKIRPLKRKEVKALKKKGFTLGNIGGDQVDDAMDAVFEIVLPPEDIQALDEFDNPDVISVWQAILKATWGSDSDTKNLSTPGDGSQTKTA